MFRSIYLNPPPALSVRYVDNFEATHDAVFQSAPHAIKFARNSAFHYLNAGRYLMAQILLHALTHTRRPADL